MATCTTLSTAHAHSTAPYLLSSPYDSSVSVHIRYPSRERRTSAYPRAPVISHAQSCRGPWTVRWYPLWRRRRRELRQSRCPRCPHAPTASAAATTTTSASQYRPQLCPSTSSATRRHCPRCPLTRRYSRSNRLNYRRSPCPCTRVGTRSRSPRTGDAWPRR